MSANFGWGMIKQDYSTDVLILAKRMILEKDKQTGYEKTKKKSCEKIYERQRLLDKGETGVDLDISQPVK